MFESWWYKLNQAKPITRDVRMTPEQFKKILNQAYNAGRKDGHAAGTKAGMDLAKLSTPSSPFGQFGNIFGGR